jgi:hypothetical protein
MKGTKRKKRSTQKARDKVEKQEEELHQGMAIRGIANGEKKKHKEEEEKSKASSERSLDLASSPNLRQDDDNAHHNNKDATTIPEVFDSSKYNSMTEMKESADMKEGGHLKEVLSSVEKEGPIKSTTMDIKSSSMDTNSHSAAASAADASPPNLEERAATLRGSKEEQIIDRNLEDSKGKSGEIIEDKDKESYAEPHKSREVADPYTIFWHDTAKSWNDLYIEYARNASEITKSWVDLFSKSWPFGYKRKKQ